MTRVKICGITRLEDAKAAVAAGADALGFVFAPSPRRVDAEHVQTITGMLPPFVDAVGVFVDEDPDVIVRTVRQCRLSSVQLHGEESPETVERLVDAGLRVIKALRVDARLPAVTFDMYESANAFLLDTFSKEEHGGTGKTFNWAFAAEWSHRYPIVLAGGLRCKNIVQAISAVRPYAVDVSSGVEQAPGVKDYDLVQQFVQRVRQCDVDTRCAV